ncbi:DUF397 domain-containing protein [Streptomyces sp. NPDC057418]|uniref:DUF397 domain-containing protein n=1 Tax=Streptomyces sp. NPDC057418 TaxID=3346126 RepID=UPI00367747FD
MITAPQHLRTLTWFKSSYSGANTTECVEAAHFQRTTAIRDSKKPAGPTLMFSQASWAAFLIGVQRRNLDG